jgi:group I intron endonuclease
MPKKKCVELLGNPKRAISSQRKRNKMYSVYEITNNINGKKYVGITSRTIEERFQEHVSRTKSYKRGNRLYVAMRKYGYDNFSVKLLAETSNENDVRLLETEFIIKYNSYENGYNCNLGGHGFLHIPEEIKAKISKAQIGKQISEEARKKMSSAKKGDKNCAKHFGTYSGKGHESPLSRYYKIKFPDGHIETIKGLRSFCRLNNLGHCKMSTNGHTKGFVLLERFRDYPEREYTQAGGSGAHPIKDEDIVRSAWQHAAA